MAADADEPGTLYAAGVDVDWVAFDRPYGAPPGGAPHLPLATRVVLVARRPASGPPRPTPAWPAAAAAAEQQAEQGPLDLRSTPTPSAGRLLDGLAGGLHRPGAARAGAVRRARRGAPGRAS